MGGWGVESGGWKGGHGVHQALRQAGSACGKLPQLRGGSRTPSGQAACIPLSLPAPTSRPPTQEEYALRQAAIKAEPLEIIYSYYNGTGHRRAITVSARGCEVCSVGAWVPAEAQVGMFARWHAKPLCHFAGPPSCTAQPVLLLPPPPLCRCARATRWASS